MLDYLPTCLPLDVVFRFCCINVVVDIVIVVFSSTFVNAFATLTSSTNLCCKLMYSFVLTLINGNARQNNNNKNIENYLFGQQLFQEIYNFTAATCNED